jgi:hypothetical protein
MHKGRAGSLLMLAGVGVVALAGLGLLVGGEDQARVYGEIGKQVNGLKHATFDQFWACALSGENVTDIRSNAELVTQVSGRGHERGRAFGVHVRDACLPKLEAIGPKLDTLIAPPDLQPDIAAMKKANADLRSAFSDYATYLDNPELDYDDAAAKPSVDAISRAWFDFVKAHGALNKTLKEKLAAK